MHKQDQNSTDGDAHGLATGLRRRIEDDWKRMHAWRLWHRSIALLFAAFTIAIPVILAADLLPERSKYIQKILLLIVALAGGLNAAFQPARLSTMRRADMNKSRRLLDDYCAKIIQYREDMQGLLNAYRTYSKEFADIYDERGQRLIEPLLAISGKRRADLG